MAKVLGVGGVFFKSADPAGLRAWYRDALGLESEQWGAVFEPQALAEVAGSATVWAPFSADTTYFAPSTKDLMINLIVDDLDGVLARCKEKGVEPLKLMPDEANGRFAHVLDPDGNKIELWQPKPMT
ncbi:MAG TPA: VOC family protein [Caulobacterales bacterium]|nr:VOC family protein [Caulobacterales bacterium]